MTALLHCFEFQNPLKPARQEAKIGNNEKKMFYSQCLLWKKGPLGSVWVAAHCFKRLKKEQVKQTDIASSVDTILNGEADVVTYRILGFLLLGIVRIYSKKVEFLFHDSRDVMDKLQNFMPDKILNKSITPLHRSYHSITLPERFELDAFDLDILEDQDASRIDVRSHDDITLADASRGEIYCINDKYYGQEDICSYEAFSSAYTPVRDVCLPEFMDIDLDPTSPYDINHFKSSTENLVETSFSLEKCLEPKMFGEIIKEPGFDMSFDERRQTDGEQIRCPDLEINCQEAARMEKSIDNDSVEPIMLGAGEKELGADLPLDEQHPTDVELLKPPDAEINCQEPVTVEESIGNAKSLEKLRELGFSSLDNLQTVIPSEVEKESPIGMPCKEGHQMAEEQIKHPDTRINFEEPEEMRLPEMTSSRNQIQEKSSLSISVSVTPDSKITGAASPDFIAVTTPATKESVRVLKKRKFLIDEKVVVSNKLIKHWINDSSDLVCKRRKSPTTALHAWKVHKIYTLPKCFLEPLIPCNGIDFRSLVFQKKSTTKVSAETPIDPVLVESPVTQISVKPAETPVNPMLVESLVMQMSVKTAETPVNPILVESPVTQISHEQTPIAPATPVTRSSSWRLHEVRGVSDMLEPASSFDGIEKPPTVNENLELDIGLPDEEVNSIVGDNPEICEWSARTRKVAKYLHQNISNLMKQKGYGVMNLSRVLERKTRTESARLFYEILALKTGDYIDVRQEDAYGDILVQETRKLQQTIDADGKQVPSLRPQ